MGDVLLIFQGSFCLVTEEGRRMRLLVLNAKIDAGEVDDQILDLELTPEGHYPLRALQIAEERKHSRDVKETVTVKDVMKLRKRSV